MLTRLINGRMVDLTRIESVVIEMGTSAKIVWARFTMQSGDSFSEQIVHVRDGDPMPEAEAWIAKHLGPVLNADT